MVDTLELRTREMKIVVGLTVKTFITHISQMLQNSTLVHAYKTNILLINFHPFDHFSVAF